GSFWSSKATIPNPKGEGSRCITKNRHTQNSPDLSPSEAEGSLGIRDGAPAPHCKKGLNVVLSLHEKYVATHLESN
ncbi:MAG: hypothetical protein WC289_06070, partial [Patescibacteria group bacterium]